MADLTIPGPTKKKKGEETSYVPEAKPVNARFISGMPVDIELNAAIANLGAVQFVIREHPRHGTLSSIRPHPVEPYKAMVTYTPKPGDASLADRFTYACRLASGGPWSAHSPVSLIGARADPRIEFLQTPSFNRVLPGFESSSKFVLKNTGIAPFAADIQWQAPWLGPPRIELGIGEEKEFLIIVKPTAPGTLIWETELQKGQPLSKMRLFVECTQLFVVAPGLLKLQFGAATGDRRGKFGVANLTDLPMKFSIEPPARLHAPKEIEVQGKQSLDVEVSLSPEDVNEFRGELWVINEPYRERVLIDAMPEPAQVVLATPKDGAIDFGTLDKGKTARLKIVLANVGGEPAVMASQAAPPFHVLESDSAVSIAAGESREMIVEATSASAGKFSGNINFSGTGGTLSLTAKFAVLDPSTPQPIRAMNAQDSRSPRIPVAKSGKGGISPLVEKPPVAAAKDAPKPPSAAPSAAPAETKPGQLSKTAKTVLGYISMYGLPVHKGYLSAHLQKIERIELLKQGRDHLEMAWSEQAGKPESYRLEQGFMVRDEPTDSWLKVWREAPNMEKINGESGRQTVRVSKLAPNSRYEFRVLGIDEKGKVSEPSDIHIFATAPPWRLPSWSWQVLVVVALAVFVFVYFRIKRGSWDI